MIKIEKKKYLGLESVNIDKLSHEERAIQEKIASIQDKIMKKCHKGFEKLSKR